MRQSILRYGGAVPAANLPRRGTQATTVTGTGVLKPYVTVTPALSTAERNVLVAFLALLGRVPERSGLSYWAGEASAASVAASVDALFSALAAVQAIDPDAAVLTTAVYLNLLGKTQSEDPAGVTYWAGQIAPTSIGSVVQQIASISAAVDGLSGDTYRNRMLVSESVARLQKAHTRDLSLQDSRVVALRVEGSVASYDAAMEDVQRLVVTGTASTPLTWGTSWTSTTLFNTSRLPDNSPVRQVRSMVWYNRTGAMMRATAYLPSTFTSGLHRAIIVAHGGGWRIGWPEALEWISTNLAAATSQTYVALAPTYALSPFGGSTPTPENDLADFRALVSAGSFLRCDPARVGIIGESSGGHLALLVGATADAWRIFALYPPTDLTGTPPVSAGLETYVNYYAAAAAARAAASPRLVWSAARNTLFRLWHGTADGFVPPAQSTDFAATVGANATVNLVSGEGHGFSTATKASLLTEARTWFAAA